MNDLILKLCTLISFYNLNQDACNKALSASYSNSTMESEINTVQNIEQRHFFEIIDKKYVYSAATLGTIINDYQTKEIRISTPLKPFFDNISIDLKNGSETYNLTCKWTF